MKRKLLLLVLLICSGASFAGTIRGLVKDAKDGSPLPGAVVHLKNTTINAITDTAGIFLLTDVGNGSYMLECSFMNYKTSSQSVTVTGNEELSVEVAMQSSDKQLEGVQVRSTRMTHTETAVLQEIKNSSVAISGISSAQIAKTMDRNAADVVKRIPGVTVQDDRFITVRGLADRYNTVWLNDAGAPGSETDKKSFSFDIIPSGLIDRILVFKTPSAELPGDFAGGMVKIYTSSLPAKNQYTFGIQTSYRQGSTGSDFNENTPSTTDWLGYDDGRRSLPEKVGAQVLRADPDNAVVSRSFGNAWAVQPKKQPLDIRMNGSAATIFSIGKAKLGNTFGFAYSQTSTNYAVQRLDWDDTTKQFHYNDLQSSRKVNVGLMDNLVFSLGRSKIEFKNLYNQIGSSTVTYRTNVIDPDLVGKVTNERSYAMGYESRATYSSQLSGTHQTESGNRKYNWTLGYTDLFKNQPNLRRIKYTENQNAPGTYIAQVSPYVDIVNGGGLYYARLLEHVYSFSHQFTQLVKIGEHFNFELNAGNYLEYKNRSFTARQLGYTLQRNATSYQLLTLPVSQIFSEENVGGEGRFQVEEATNDYDRYEASNRLIASFVSVQVPVTARIKVLAGVRYEDNLYQLKGSVNQHPSEPEISTQFLLPSLNTSYHFSPKSLLRLAYGKTVNRPEFRETAPFYFYDFDRRAGTYGALFPHSFAMEGDTLKVAEIQNLDARYEWYPTPGEMVHAGIFYKHFKNPIQQVSYGSGDSRSFTTVNAESSYVYGLELDVRKQLAFLDDRLHTGFFKHLTYVGNLSLSKSELSIDAKRVTDALAKTSLEGQSNYVINSGLFYQNDRLNLQASALYNVFGPRLYSVGTTYDPSIGELSFHALDLTLAKTFYRHYIVNVGVQNLLDQSVRYVIDTDENNKFSAQQDRPYSSYKPGRYFSLGLKVRF